MGLLEILKTLVYETKIIDVSKLPSQSLFYKDDFKIKIKKADIEDIIEYEYRFDKDNLMMTIECIKYIVNKNVILNEGYTYEYIKSVDIIFIFLEIVKFTTNKEIKVAYINNLGKEDSINFDIDHFSYFKFDRYLPKYDKESKEIIFDGYKFSLPSIGVETSLTTYLSNKSKEDEVKMLSKVSYDFMFFLGDKTSLKFSEIDNLIQIFNFDLEESELNKIKKIVDKFKNVVGYSLIIDGYPIEIKTKINLSDIWKI